MKRLSASNQIPRIVSLAFNAAPTINADNADVVEFPILTGAVTSLTTNLAGTPFDGQKLIIRFHDNGSAEAITHGSSFTSSGVASLITTTVVGKTVTEGLMWDAGIAKWVCLAADAVGY